MARVKTKVQFHATEKAPEGMEFVDVKRKVGDTKDVVLRVLVPKADASGLIAAPKFLSSIFSADGPDGTVFCAEAIRQAIVTSITSIGKDTEVAKVPNIVPRVAALKVVDKAAVAGARLEEFINAHGKPPSASELAKIYAGLSL